MASRAKLFRGEDGLDELTTTGIFDRLRREGRRVRETHLDPDAVGLAARAARGPRRRRRRRPRPTIARAILEGERGPRRDVVLLNAGAALEVAGFAADLQEGMATAARAIDDGDAARTLARWVEVSRRRPGSIGAPMILSDRDIRAAIDAGRVVIDPFDPACVQPSSVDLHVDSQFRVFANSRYPFIDVREEMPDLTELVEVEARRAVHPAPGEFVLGSTLERVALPDDLVARLEGKSSLGRLGLLIHSTAGYVDPGWDGYLTLELSNVANLPITLYPGMKIGQISFFRLTSPAETPYGAAGNKYQGQRGPTPSRFYRDFG